MGRVINPETAGQERNRLAKSVVVAIRELMRQTEIDPNSQDLAAFIALALAAMAGTIDISVTAWEKRGYWVKADRYRMEWIWTEKYAGEMRQAVLTDDWGKVAEIAAKTAVKLSGVKVSANHRLGKPWVGAWKELNRGE